MKKRLIIFSATVCCIIASAFALCGCGVVNKREDLSYKTIYIKNPWGQIVSIGIDEKDDLISIALDVTRAVTEFDVQGYGVLGYYNAAIGGSKYSLESFIDLPAGTVVYARYAPLSDYKINLYDEGAATDTAEPLFVVSQITFDADVGTTLPIPTEMPQGAAFDGWFGGENGDIRMTDDNGTLLPERKKFNEMGGYVTIKDDGRGKNMIIHPLFARYTYPKYTVTLDYGTEHGLEATERECAHGEVPDLPQLTDGDYIIKEWSTDALGYDVYDGAGVTEDITLYAIWRRHRYVGLWSGGEKIRELSLFEDDSVGLDEFGLEYPNKVFDGWYTDPEFDPSTRVYTAVYADYNALYAKWIDL